MVRNNDYLPRSYQQDRQERRRISPPSSSSYSSRHERSNYDRRPQPPRRDFNYRRQPAGTLFSRDHTQNIRSSSRRQVESNPFSRGIPSSSRRPARSSDRYETTLYPNSSYSNDRRPAYNSYGNRWLPPVRNPARYIDPPIREQRKRSSERQSERRPNTVERDDEPIKKKRKNSGGPSTPPERDDRSSIERHDCGGGVGEEEIEILEIVHVLFRYCYQQNKENQNARFSWLKNRICDLRKEIELLRGNGIEDLGELEEIDCTEKETNGNLSMIQNEILDYDENADDQPPDASSSSYDLKSPVDE